MALAHQRIIDEVIAFKLTYLVEKDFQHSRRETLLKPGMQQGQRHPLTRARVVVEFQAISVTLIGCVEPLLLPDGRQLGGKRITRLDDSRLG